MPGVPRSTCYWMIGHPGTARADPVAGGVRAVRRDSRGRYGAEDQGRPGKEGRTASGRRIGGIMRERGMRARTRADGPNRTGRGPTRPGPRTYRTRGSGGYVFCFNFFLSNFCTIFPQYRLPVSRRSCTV